jgi:hypothetical protein
MRIASKEVKKEKMVSNRATIQERINAVKESGIGINFPSILKFQIGDNTLEILDSEPAIEGKFGWLYPAVVNGQKGRVSLGKYLEPKVLALVSQGITRMRVTRVGTGLDTRFLVTPLTGKNPTETEKV